MLRGVALHSRRFLCSAHGGEIFPVFNPITNRVNLTSQSTSQSNFPENDFIYIPNCITPDEADLVVFEFSKQLKRKRYESGHWDAVIEDFREFEKSEWKSEAANAVSTKIQNTIVEAMGESVEFLQQCHVIDLKDSGFIRPHVDSVKFSGKLVAGVSLLSDAVMRFCPSDLETGQPLPNAIPTDKVLEQNSLYIMKGDVRYHYTHEILPLGADTEVWDEQRHTRGRRISLMYRDVLPRPDGATL
eukprot:m.884784 g.884784  ORF g.884784 m.884784 type:complete len:244 (+) comp23613_c0_seq55:203-934(+)